MSSNTPAAMAQPFTTVIDVPPDIAPTTIGSDTQLNLSGTGTVPNFFNAGLSNGSSTNVEVNIAGGSVGVTFDAHSGSTVNISGGTVGNGFNAFSNSLVNLTGGMIGSGFEAHTGSLVNLGGTAMIRGVDALDGSVVNISGGTVTDDLVANAGSTVNISGGILADRVLLLTGSAVTIAGGEFLLNGTPLVVGAGGTPVDIPDGSRLTVTLADGTVRTLGLVPSDRIDDGTLKLTNAPLPTAANTINIPVDPVPAGLRGGQTLNLASGGHLPENFTAVNATLNIAGGFIDTNFIAEVGSTVSISGGEINQNAHAFSGTTFHVTGGIINHGFTAHPGSTININGGEVRASFEAMSGSVVNIDSGQLGALFDAKSGSAVTITGGSVGFQFDAEGGSTVNISGGQIDNDFTSHAGSQVNISGGEFFLDGAPINLPGGSVGINIPEGSHMTATLADGTVRSFGNVRGDTIADDTMILISTPLPSGVSNINVPSDPAPPGLRVGQTLNLETGGSLGSHFTAFRSTMNITGGYIDKNFLADIDSVINLNDGEIDHDAQASGSTINVDGGKIGWFFKANAGSTININAGNVGIEFHATNSTVNIAGGEIDSGFQADVGSTVNISGGIVGDRFQALPDSKVNLIGHSFILDGMDLSTTLRPGEPLLITDRNVILEGLLADNTPFSFELNSSFVFDDFFDPNATLTIALVPEPATLGLIGVGSMCLLRRRDS